MKVFIYANLPSQGDPRLKYCLTPVMHTKSLVGDVCVPGKRKCEKLHLSAG